MIKSGNTKDQSSTPFLRPNETVNSDHPRVIQFARRNTTTGDSPNHRAMELYYAVRDQIYYDPYQITLTVAGLRASTTLENGFGWCVSKAALLAACCRAVNIPAALGYADVRNHLTTDRLRKRMKSDIFYWHGYTSIFLDDHWVKSTPVFNKSLCEKLTIKPLDFDGRTDCLLQPFDQTGRRHMEYFNDHGIYDAIPIEEIRNTFENAYPQFPFPEINADFTTDININKAI